MADPTVTKDFDRSTVIGWQAYAADLSRALNYWMNEARVWRSLVSGEGEVPERMTPEQYAFMQERR